VSRAPAGGRSRAVPVLLVLLLLAGGAAWAWSHASVGGLLLGDHCEATAAGATADLDPEQAGNAAIITVVAVRRGLPARAASIAIATAMQESKLRNVQYGDRDSLGLFQQRPSQGWGTRAEILDPVHATNSFYDALIAVKGYQAMPIGEVAQKVQRSAHPSAYADHEPSARVIASVLSGYSPGAFTCALHTEPSAARTAPGQDGLDPRARAVAKSAAAETGRDGAAAASTDGTALRFSLTGAEARRDGWSLAHWAVARSEALGIVSVATDGRQWRRHGGTGWTPMPGAPMPGTVVVRVAPG